MGVTARLAGRAALVALLPGCFAFTTKHEGSEMKKRIANLEERVAKQEQSVGTKVEQLDESLEKATRLLARNSADLGAQVQQMSEEIARLTGEITALRRDHEQLRQELAALKGDVEQRHAAFEARLQSLEKGGAARPSATPVPPADKTALFDGATRKLEAGEYEEARKDLRAYVRQFPSDEKADDAQYLVGESFFREKQYEKAIAEFQRVIDAFAGGDMVDDAFFQAGTAAAAMKWCTDARAYFGVLLQRFPKSPFAKPAQQKLDYLKKQAKNKQVCQS